ncbi:extracellular dioxygenase [Moniliophthora roreri MCA 2997]|uniref:Extracellular dioxygenase n=1 Tax=Moniliophthora roreri (strain MCA 2997) TaxID=1381753 RepID=V2YLX4_MONRO|nr:extracellular dioxygenase [Moniliophthora roreri MCA 2997]
MKFTASIISTVLLFGVASALPTETARSLVPRDCSAEIEALNVARMAKRGLDKRSFWPSIQNVTCVLAPEVPRSDWVAGAPVRQDVREGQQGVDFVLDIGLMDTTTCQPLANAIVEIWSPNQVGQYGNTFLRGAFASSEGIAEFQTKFPGYTSEGANHINIQVFPNGKRDSVAHVGQLFFTDPWTDIISKSQGYAANTNTRIKNAQDPNFGAANANGFKSIVDLVSIQDDWPAGVIGAITVGVNPSQSVAV